MINTFKGDLLEEVQTNAVIVHGCNAQGVMGGGFALAVRRKYPQVYAEYEAHHRQYGFKVGDIHAVKVNDRVWVPQPGQPPVLRNLTIINAITQDQYGTDRRYVDYEGVAVAFEKINALMLKTPNVDKPGPVYPPLCFPLIGAGLAGGDWAIIKTIIDQTVSESIDKICYVL